METLRGQLVRAEQRFLLAVVSREEGPLEDFSQEWLQLSNHIKSIEATNRLDDKTALLFFHVSKAIESVVDCMLQSEAMLQDAQPHLIGDLVHESPPDTLSTSSHPLPIAPHYLLFSHHSSLSEPVVFGRNEALDIQAYRWLMQNIHNPYPTSAQMRMLGDLSGAQTTQVESWFQEARVSIEWTKLSHDFFAGSSEATVSAARQVYLEHDRNVPHDIVFAFASVKAFAETLFSQRATLPESQADADLVQTLDSGGATAPVQAGLSMSPNQSFDRLDSNEGEEEDCTPSPPVAGCKRRLAEGGEISQASDFERPQKRLRTPFANDFTLHDPEPTRCSSPSLSGLTTTLSSDKIPMTLVASVPCPQSLISLAPSPGTSTSNSRKRERSDFEISSGRANYSPESLRVTRRRKLLGSTSPPSTEQLLCPHVIPESIFSLESVRYPKSSPPSDVPPVVCDPTPSTLQLPIYPHALFDIDFFDWNKMLDPLAETVPLMSQPLSIYVPGSDLPSLEPTTPARSDVTQSVSSWWVSDLGSSEDLSPLLQLPESMYPGPSTSSTTSLYSDSETPPLSLQDDDSRNVDVFSEQSPSVSSQSLLSPPPSLNAFSPAPNTPGNSMLRTILSPSHGIDIDKTTPIWDPSTPPSIFLPEQPVALNDYEHSIWPLLFGGS